MISKITYLIKKHTLQRRNLFCEINSERIKLVCVSGRIMLYYDDVLLTKDVGFSFAVFKNGVWEDSTKAKWKISKSQNNNIRVEIDYDSGYLSQIWEIGICQGVINWQITSTFKRDVYFDEVRVLLFMDPVFDRWVFGCDEGHFPRIVSWQEMPLNNTSAKFMAVKAGHSQKNLPSVVFDYSSYFDNVVAGMQNTSSELGARVMSARLINRKFSQAQTHYLFSKIRILSEKNAIDNLVEEYRKNLYLNEYCSKNKRDFCIVIANLPWYDEHSNFGIRAGSRWPHIKDATERDYLPFPFFKAYATSLLRKNGFNVVLIDAIAEGLSCDEFLRRILSLNPALIVCETSIPSMDNDISILNMLPGSIKKALTGPNAHIKTNDFFEKNTGIDFVFDGEYEFILLELAECLLDKKPFDDVKGLIYRNGKEIIFNQKRPLLEDLDLLPWPARSDLPMYKYIDAPGNIPLPSAQMWASRGCPFSCSFCAWPQLMYGSKNYRMRSAKDIVDEMEFLVSQMGFKSIYFDDDTFNVNRKNVVDFCDELIARRKLGKIFVPWAMMARADLMDEELLCKLKHAGLFSVKYGVESASQEILDGIGKNMNLDKTIEMIELTNRLGIKTHLTFTFGLPGENKDSVRKTIDLAIRLNPQSLQFSIATPFPGTRFYDYAKKMGYLVDESSKNFDGNRTSVIKTQYLTKEDLENARKTAYFLWGEHVKKRSALKLFSSPMVLFRKLFVHLKSFGVIATIRKTCDFLRFIFKSRIQKIIWKVSAFNEDNFLIKQDKGSNRRFVCVSNFRNNMALKLGVLSSRYAFIGPKTVQLDLTNKCNHKCLACWMYSDLLGDKKNMVHSEELPKEKVLELIDEFADMNVEQVQLSGGGDPLLYEYIEDVVRYIKSKKLKLSIITNGLYLDEQKIKYMCACGVDMITVSLWASNADVYKKLHSARTDSDFENIISNIKNLVGTIEGSRNAGDGFCAYPKVKIYNVVCHQNSNCLLDMVKLCKELSVDYLEFSVVDIFDDLIKPLALSFEDKQVIKNQMYAVASESEYLGQKCGDIASGVEIEKIGELNGFGKFIRNSSVLGFEFDLNYPRVICPNKKINTSLHVRKDDKNIFVVEFCEGVDNYGQKIKDDVCAACNKCVKFHNKRLFQLKYMEVTGVGTFIRRVNDNKENNYDYKIIEKYRCHTGWLYSRISVNGDVLFCCKSGKKPVGNVYKDSFKNIWNGEKQKCFRSAALKKSKTDGFFKDIRCGRVCDNLGMGLKSQFGKM